MILHQKPITANILFHNHLCRLKKSNTESSHVRSSHACGSHAKSSYSSSNHGNSSLASSSQTVCTYIYIQ